LGRDNFATFFRKDLSNAHLRLPLWLAALIRSLVRENAPPRRRDQGKIGESGWRRRSDSAIPARLYEDIRLKR
jgi:hypothetical protein